MAKWGSCDFSQLKAFQKKLEKLEKEQDAFLSSCAKELAARLLAKVIKRTPVGKKPKFAGVKTAKVKGASGKTRSFLTAEGARYEKYWGGYTGGTLRRGWTCKTEAEAKNGGNKPVSTYVKSLQVSKKGSVYEITVFNPVHYASYVEYGHRQEPGRYVPAIGKQLVKGWVPGKLMLTTSEMELQEQAAGILERKLKQRLEECFRD